MTPRCPDTVNGQHGPADAYGRCPWCGVKFTVSAWAPERTPCTELTDAYGLHFDPDWTALDPDQIRDRYQSGRA